MGGMVVGRREKKRMAKVTVVLIFLIGVGLMFLGYAKGYNTGRRHGRIEAKCG